MRSGERTRPGHLRLASQATWPGCCERSQRKAPKKNCIPKAAAEG